MVNKPHGVISGSFFGTISRRDHAFALMLEGKTVAEVAEAVGWKPGYAEDMLGEMAIQYFKDRDWKPSTDWSLPALRRAAVRHHQTGVMPYDERNGGKPPRA